MARNASGEFYYPPGTAAVPDEVARSADVNQRFAELAQDANTPRPVLVGGTGSSTAAGARANLGITPAAIGALPVAGKAADTTLFEGLGLASFARVGQANAFTAVQTATGFTVSGAGNGAVYHPGNKPTAADVGALPVAGKAADATLFEGLGLSSFARNGQANVFTAVQTATGFTVSGAGNGAVYHPGNKPTPEAIGAMPLAQAVAPNAVGTSMFARSTAAIAAGESASGSTLTVAGVTSAGALFVGAATLPGTWSARGTCPANGATTFTRIM